MSETAEKFSVAARNPDPSFGHWSTYLKEGQKEEVVGLVRNLLHSVAIPYQPDETNFPDRMTNSDMAVLLCTLAGGKNLTVLDKILEAGVPIDICDKDGAYGLTPSQMRKRWLLPRGMAALLERGAHP